MKRIYQEAPSSHTEPRTNATDQGLFLPPWGPDSDSRPQGPCWPSSMRGGELLKRAQHGPARKARLSWTAGSSSKMDQAGPGVTNLTGEEMGLSEANAGLKSPSWPANPVS